MTHAAGSRSPKSTGDDKTAFRRLVPDDERVTTRPMFGSLAAFANGYMFMGLYGPELFVRVPEEQRAARLEAGWHNLEAMPGKPMHEYFVVPADWRTSAAKVRQYAGEALDYALGLPPKK